MARRMNQLVARCRQFLGPARKPVVAVVGGTVVLVGIAMVVLPGPAFVVIPLGLAILATEFVWARRWLKRARALLPQTLPRGWRYPQRGARPGGSGRRSAESYCGQ